MARNLYSLRILAVGNLIPATGIVGPTVPDEFVYVVRDIDVVRRSTGTSDGLFIIAQTGGLLVFVGPGVVDANGNYAWRGRQVYGPGERVAVESGGGAWDVAISGYQLTLP